MSDEGQKMSDAKDRLLCGVAVHSNPSAMDFVALAFFDIANAIRELARAVKEKESEGRR